MSYTQNDPRFICDGKSVSPNTKTESFFNTVLQASIKKSDMQSCGGALRLALVLFFLLFFLFFFRLELVQNLVNNQRCVSLH